MFRDGLKEVYFGKYCRSCEHRDTDSDQEPCNECLGEPMNVHSHKPVRWKEREKPVSRVPKKK